MDEYYFYGDERNAVRRTRAPAPAASRAVLVPAPGGMQPAPAPMSSAQPTSVFQPAPAPAAPFYNQPSPYGGPSYGPPPTFPPPYNMPSPYAAPYAAPAYPVAYGPPPYGSPYGMPGSFYPAPTGNTQQPGLLGGINFGTLAKLGLEGFAALKQLPPPPVAGTDVATNLVNLITYQTELAKHAKLDEQLRTAGTLAETLFPAL